ncbi:hypothetical protein CVT24_003769 [Panaeolus cyanescens]|uniref:F-box domain-containing protein n=1 Tax=Panaeolus cyanescens TaxID=181874 RepID=A0A409WC50_9AGAR|nr:hypothetical protein CVT24_003769 [Panaeolus cyanescens]
MPPKKRSKRGQASARASTAAVRGVNGTTGYLALPIELHAEIISHLPKYPICCEAPEKSDYDKQGRDRHFTLHSLSRVCHALRVACLPYLWEGIEVYEGFKIPGKGTRLGKIPIFLSTVTVPTTTIPNARASRNYAEELLRQLEVVTVRNPALAKHVKFVVSVYFLIRVVSDEVILENVHRFMNVTLTPISLTAVREELIRCLPLFPNLTTVRMIIWRCWEIYAGPQDITLPQIRTLYLNGAAAWLANKCPNARSIAFTSEQELSVCQDAFYWLNEAKAVGKSLEVLGLFPYHHRSDFVGKLWAHFPSLRDVTVDCYMFRTTVGIVNPDYRTDPLSKLENLQIIRIRADLHIGYNSPRVYDVRPKEPPLDEQETYYEWAQKTLLKVQERDKLEKRVYFTRPTGEYKLLIMNVGRPVEEKILRQSL